VVAAEAAALAAWRVTSVGDRVGGLILSDDGIDVIRPRSRQAAIGPLFEAITRRNRALSVDAQPSDPSAFNAALAKVPQLLRHDGLLCLISDAAGADDETVRLVTEITAHNDVLTIFIFDPLEAELPDIGRIVLAEGESEITIDSSAGSLRGSFASSFRDRRATIERFSRRRAIPVLPLTTARDTVEQLHELLGRRLEKTISGSDRRAG